MSLELKNIIIKELGIHIKFSFDIKVEKNMIGKCNISIDNLLNQLELVDDERSYFHFIPSHDSCQSKQNSRKNDDQSKTTEDLSQESMLENDAVTISEENNAVTISEESIYQPSRLSENYTESSTRLRSAENRNNDLSQIESLIQNKKTVENDNVNALYHDTENQTNDEIEASVEKQKVKRKSQTLKSQANEKIKPAYLCKTCLKYYTSKSRLDRHIQTHTKPYQCKDCGKFFSQQKHLKIHHDNIHKGIKYFKCTECDKGFVTKIRLDAHMRSHQGIKPFKCQVCGLCFSWKRSLVTHEKTHQGDDPFICGECGKEFKERKELKVHTGEFHKGGKPFYCCKCNRNFSRRSHLTRHYASHHR
uniref:C2H2-type domain-containing protein n=1 Tax=Clytia hemisphaerica TaxID=252671 RepID=A0A7M5UNZ6_9CNID